MRVNVWLLLLFAYLAWPAKTLADELAGERIAEPALNEGLNVYVTHPGEKGYYLAEREIWFGFFTRTNRKSPTFEQAKGCLMVGESAIPYSEAAQQLQMEEGAFRVAVHRLRKRYRELLREEIAQTLSDPAQVEEELRFLRSALAS